MSHPGNALEVWLDCDRGPPCLVGTLAHDRGQIRFHYERGWLSDARAFALDPDLSLDEAPFFPKPELGNFGMRVVMSYQPNTLAQQFTVDVLYGAAVLRNTHCVQVRS